VGLDRLPQPAANTSTPEVWSYTNPGPAKAGPGAENLRLFAPKPDRLAIQERHQPERPPPTWEHPPLVHQQGGSVHVLGG
jgi:hypothetical protein